MKWLTRIWNRWIHRKEKEVNKETHEEGTSPSHEFDKALDEKLASSPREAFEEGEHTLQLKVTLRYEDNPGWVVDRYDVE
jgi:hypothetical protein